MRNNDVVPLRGRAERIDLVKYFDADDRPLWVATAIAPNGKRYDIGSADTLPKARAIARMWGEHLPVEVYL